MILRGICKGVEVGLAIVERDPAKGRGIQNGWKDPDPVFWKLPSHEQQERHHEGGPT